MSPKNSTPVPEYSRWQTLTILDNRFNSIPRLIMAITKGANILIEILGGCRADIHRHQLPGILDPLLSTGIMIMHQNGDLDETVHRGPIGIVDPTDCTGEDIGRLFATSLSPSHQQGLQLQMIEFPFQSR